MYIDSAPKQAALYYYKIRRYANETTITQSPNDVHSETVNSPYKLKFKTIYIHHNYIAT